MNDLCDKTQESDLILNKSCAKDTLDDLDADSRSSSTASPLSLSSHTGLSQSSLGALSDPSPSPDLAAIKTDPNINKPRIWSLAHTATSSSPPQCRKSPQPSVPPPTSSTSLYGLPGNPHVPQAHLSTHPGGSLTATTATKMGMAMSAMSAHHQNPSNRPDLRTWIEGAFHGASALTAMGIAAQYHGLVSSANSLGVHTGQANNMCVGNGAAAAAMAAAIASQGTSVDRVSAVGSMGSHPNSTLGTSSSSSTHGATLTSTRPPGMTTGLESPSQPNSTSAASISCRLPPSSGTGLKVGVGFPNSCNSVNAIGQTSLFAGVKSGLCGLTGKYEPFYQSV